MSKSSLVLQTEEDETAFSIDKDVTVPNSAGQKGIEVAAILGALGGNLDKQLEILTEIALERIAISRRFIKKQLCQVERQTDCYFTIRAGEETVDDIAGAMKKLHLRVRDRFSGVFRTITRITAVSSQFSLCLRRLEQRFILPNHILHRIERSTSDPTGCCSAKQSFYLHARSAS